MALVPIISQSWDTTSVFTPTRMNNIEQNLAIVSDATGVKYSNGVSVKDKIPQTITKQITTDANGGATLDIDSTNYVVMSATKLRDSTENTFAWGGLGRLVDGSYTIHLMTYDNQNFANKTCNVEIVYMKR